MSSFTHQFCLKIKSFAEKKMTHLKILGFKGVMETENGASKSKMEDYAGIQHIGRGSFGAAFLVHHKTDNNK